MTVSMPPDPTPEEVLSYAPFAGGRISVAWDALRRLMLDVLPGALNLANSNASPLGVRRKNGSRELLRLPIPKECQVAPEKLAGDFPMLVISSSIGMNDFTPMQSEMTGDTIIYLAYNSLLSAGDIKNSHDTLDIINMLLYPFRAGHTDAGGLRVWDELVPGQRVFLRGLPGWENARGFAQHYNIVQFPGEERWAPLIDG